MLMLSRNVGESFRVGEETVITLISVSGRQARLGIDAPREIKIVREEQYQGLASANIRRKSESIRK